MYNSPIEVIFDDIKTNLEGYVVNSVQRMGICVDKDELVKALEYDRGQYERGYRDGKLYAMDEMPHWIPCSERLPEANTRCLCTYENEEGTCIDFGLYMKRGWFVSGVTAWMPLPEPYKEDADDPEG